MSKPKLPPKVSGLVLSPPSKRLVGIGATFSSETPTPANEPTALLARNADGFDYVDSSTAVLIPVRLLDDSPDQYRLSYDEDELEALASTLKERQRDPIEVRRKPNGRFEVIKGHRRKRAANRAGLEYLKAVVVDLDDCDAAIDLVLSNESQEQVGDFERAIAYKNLMAYKLTQADICRKLGIASRSLVAQRLRFLELPTSIQDALREYPRAYSYRPVATLLDILKNNPELEGTIAEGTRKVGAGDWDVGVLISTLRQKQAKIAASDTKPKNDLSIVDKNNRPIITVRPGKRADSVELVLAEGIDRNTFIGQLGGVLREKAEDDVFSSPGKK